MNYALNFTQKPIAVIGDLMLDEFIFGSAVRLSPEAPVPIVKVERREYRLGGAGNVAANIKSLGGNPIVIGLLGNRDDASNKIRDLFVQRGMTDRDLYYSPDRKTTVKTRVVVNKHQIVRFDEENTNALSKSATDDFVSRMQHAISNAAAVIVSDYSKGVITPFIMNKIVEFTRDIPDIPIFVDPKIQNAVTYYGFRNAVITCMTPNLAEAQGLVGDDVHRPVDQLARDLVQRFNTKYMLVTQGDEGMTLLADDKAVHIPTTAQEVFDVAGAGDTVIAALTLAHTSGFSITDSARLANVAAGIAVGKSGTHSVTIEELCAKIQ